MTKDTLAAPCEGCHHAVRPSPTRNAGLSFVAENRLFRTMRDEERQLAGKKLVVALGRPPAFEPYCGVRSIPKSGQYLFCGSAAGLGCDSRRCSLAGIQCKQCASGTGICENRAIRVPGGPSVGTLSVELGTAVILETSQQRLGELFEGGYEQQIDYTLADVKPEKRIAIEDDASLNGGLAQTVLVFGGPGSGKTYLFMRMLRQYLSLTMDGLQPGALILDPKGVLYEELYKMLDELGRSGDLVVLGPSDIAAATNILDVGGLIAPQQLGHLVADIVMSSFASIGDSWEPFLYDVLETAVIILTHLDGHVTLKSLVDGITTLTSMRADADGKPRYIPEYYRRAMIHKDEGSGALLAPDDGGFDEAFKRIKMLVDGPESPRQIGYIVQLVRNGLGAAAGPAWKAMSTPRAAGTAGVLESPFSEGKIVLVSIGEGDPVVRRCVSTTAKAVFQIIAGSRSSAGRTSKAWRTRGVTLACDEFAQIITERDADGLSDSSFFSRSRQYKCFNLLALQSVHMGMARVKNASLWNAVVGNANVRIFMSVNDAETAALASAISGRRTVLSPVESFSDASSGRSFSQGTSMVERSNVPEIVPLQGFQRGYGVAIGRLDGRTPSVSYFRVPK